MSHNTNLKQIKRFMDYGYILTIPAVSTALQGIIPEESLEPALRVVYKALQNVVEDFAERMLSEAENRRVCDALILASQGIHKRIENGEIPRRDGFFYKDFSGRSGDREIIENVLLKCQREPEEKKIPYISSTYVNIVFELEFSADLGHKIIKSAEQLTYQQLCIMSMVGRRENSEEVPRTFGLNLQLNPPLELSKLLHDCFELVTNGYIQGGLTLTSSGQLPRYETLNPHTMYLENIGIATFKLMNLRDIPDDDIVRMAELLGWEKSTSSESGEVSWNPKV